MGIAKARVQGGRVKRLIVLFVSASVIAGSIWLMYRYSFVHKSKHVILLSNPMTLDSASNHYFKADLKIKTADGYTMQERYDNSHIFEIKLSLTQLHKKKEPGTSLPAINDVRYLNYCLGDSIISYVGDTIDSKYFPVGDIGNLIVFGHYYNCDYTEIHREKPWHGLVDEDDNIYSKTGKMHGFVIRNDPACLTLPICKDFHDKLVKGKTSFAGDFNVDWNFLITPNNEETFDFSRNTNNSNKNTWIGALFKLHDISKRYYEFDVFTKSIDELNLTFESNEMVEISHPFASAHINENSIDIRIRGDHYSNSNEYGGYQKIALVTKNLESENTQLVRMFLLMTFCSFALGYFLKTLSDYLWILIRKIQKRGYDIK